MIKNIKRGPAKNSLNIKAITESTIPIANTAENIGSAITPITNPIRVNRIIDDKIIIKLII